MVCLLFDTCINFSICIYVLFLIEFFSMFEIETILCYKHIISNEKNEHVFKKIKILNNMTSTLRDSYLKRESLKSVKHVLYIALSTVLKLRKYVKAENIEERDYGDLKVSVLSSNTKSNTSQQWVRDISAAFQSIDLGYLKSLTLSFKEKGQSDTIFESYNFQIDYDEARVFLSKASLVNESLDCTNLELSKLITWLSTTISLMEDLPKGKTGANLSLEYHKRTPIDYKINGFRERQVSFKFANDAFVFDSKELETPYMFTTIMVDKMMLKYKPGELDDSGESEEYDWLHNHSGAKESQCQNQSQFNEIAWNQNETIEQSFDA